MTIEATVDRIEGSVAVLELSVSGDTVDWPVTALPPGVVEGQRLQIAVTTCGGAALDEAEARLQRLRARSPDDDGEIDL